MDMTIEQQHDLGYLESLIVLCKKHKVSELSAGFYKITFSENAFAEKLDDDMLKELIKKTSTDDLLFASANN